MSALVFGLLVGMGVAHAPEVAQAVSPSESPAVVVAAPPQGGPPAGTTSPSPIGGRPKDAFAMVFGARPRIGVPVAPVPTFVTPAPRQQGGPDEGQTVRRADRLHRVCGMLVIPVGPGIDPKMVWTLPEDGPRYSGRRIPPPACNR